MSDDDLIRRGDALNACRASEHRYEAFDAIDALTAVTQPAPDAAADRIKTLEAKLAKAADVIDWALIAWDEHWVHGLNMQGDWVHDARATLAELTGGKDD